MMVPAWGVPMIAGAAAEGGTGDMPPVAMGLNGETEPDKDEGGREPLEDEAVEELAALRKSRTSFDKFCKEETRDSILGSC